jgi:hypothetical protein
MMRIVVRFDEFCRRRLDLKEKQKNEIGISQIATLWLWAAVSLPVKGKARLDSSQLEVAEPMAFAGHRYRGRDRRGSRGTGSFTHIVSNREKVKDKRRVTG